MTDLSNCCHVWKLVDVSDCGVQQRYECICLLSTAVPYDGLCPDRVAAALEAAYQKGREDGRDSPRYPLRSNL
jgi:hypothetical protein